MVPRIIGSPLRSVNMPTPGSSGSVPVTRMNSVGVGEAIWGLKVVRLLSGNAEGPDVTNFEGETGGLGLEARDDSSDRAGAP